MFNPLTTENAWPQGRDRIVDDDFMLDFWPQGIDVVEDSAPTRVNHDPVPYTPRKPPMQEIDLEEDADWLQNDARSVVMMTRDVDDVPENYVAFSEEEEGELRGQITGLAAEFREILMTHSATSVMASDRAASEFEAILKDAFGVTATVDRSVEELSSMVLDMETLGFLLSKTKHIPDSVKRVTLTRAVEDGFEQLKLKRNSKKRLAFQSLMSANANLVAGADSPHSRMATLGKHTRKET